MRRLAPALLLAIGLSITGAPAGADTYKPTRFDDPPPGKCKPGDCSLREAISKANRHEGRDRVVLGQGIYGIELPEMAGDDNKGGDLDVTGEVKILGKGINRTTVDGNEVSRVFTMATFPAKTMERLTIKEGRDDVGAGIFSGPQKLTLRDVVIEESGATEDGGGIYTVSEDLRLIRVTIRGNHADIGGGGIYSGAGIVGTPHIDIRQSTISGNTAALGAGLYLNGFNPPQFDFDPTGLVVNSTLAGNMATVSGGGMAAIQGSALSVDNTTIAFNAADTDNSGGGSGGGVFQSSGGDFRLFDSVVQGNTVGSTGEGRTCAGEFVMTYVIYAGQSAGSCSFLGGSITQEELDPPKLGALADNGGKTETIELLTGSAAIGFSDNGCPGRDQRGVVRPETDCDAGAFEREGP